MKGRKNRARFSFFGYVVYFIAIAAVVSVAFLVYGFISDMQWGKGTVAAVLLCCILFLALLCTGADVLRRKLMVERPVRKILEATDRIAAGDFSVRLEPSHAYVRYNAYDEIMENLNSMASALSQTEVLRTDFIANVSHELKTPLAVIRSYAEALQNGALSVEERREYAQTVASAAARLSVLIENILKLNKLENGKILPEMRSADLSERLRTCVLQFEEAMDRKQQELECDIDEITAVTDASLLEIVWSNLLSNAVKFTPPGGKIGVSFKREGEYAVMQVRDTGCGMSAETGAHIFEKFYQGDTSHSQEGNGLGLALVKKVIDIIGGQISVESAEGKGSIFTVKIKIESI